MLFVQRVPRPLRWIVSIVLIWVLVMGVSRLLLYYRFNPPGRALSGSTLLMGLRFDCKFACILGLAILVLMAFPWLNPFKRTGATRFWNLLLPLLMLFTGLLYVVDYFHYDYLQQRLNASLLNYFNDASITLKMGVQSYPVIKVSLLLLAGVLLFYFIFRQLLRHFLFATVLDTRKGAGWYIFCFLLLALGVFGKLGQFNLRWSDAYTLSDNFKGNMALNPFQSFFSSLRYRDTGPNKTLVKQYYPLMAGYLGVQQPDSATLNFERSYTFPATAGRPNVVLVICESFCMYRSTMAGNHYNTTPYFDALCKQGVFFNRCFTPSFPTARGVWATITSLPDVLGDNNRTASRNPTVVSQRTIMNELPGYEKFYFLGGDPTWANIKGVLLNNIDSLHLYSQENFTAKKVDVWGIDDKSLLLESNKILAAQRKPFFAVIQTADNHRPYTIPEEDLKQFKKVQYPADSVRRYGFDDIDQLNAFRYTDFCFEQFMEAARKEAYFGNTIFVFVGDHGLPGNASTVYPDAWTEGSLTREHVPLLFYAPKLLPARTASFTCSQLDIMPSVASLLKVNYSTSGLGQSLFDNRVAYPQSAFVIDHEAGTRGMVTNDYYYQKNILTGKEKLYPLTPTPAANADSTRKALATLTTAYYETARYLLYNNKRK